MGDVNPTVEHRCASIEVYQLHMVFEQMKQIVRKGRKKAVSGKGIGHRWAGGEGLGHELPMIGPTNRFIA